MQNSFRMEVHVIILGIEHSFAKPPRFLSPEAHSVSGWIFNDRNFYAILSRAIKLPLNGILSETMRTLIGVSMSSRLSIKLAPHPETSLHRCSNIPRFDEFL